MNQNEQKQYFPSIIPFRDGEKWGYSDRNKRLLVDPKYTQTFPFVGNIAKIKLNEKYGLVDRTGNEIIPPDCEEIGDYYEGVLLNEDGSCFIHRGGKIGLIATTGELLADINHQTEDAAMQAAAAKGWQGGIPSNHFPDIPSQQLASIQAIKNGYNDILRFKQRNRWGLMTRTGEIILSPQYDIIEAIENKNWPFCSQGKWGLLNLKGEVVLPAIYDAARGFCNGQAACRIGNLWGAVAPSGKWIYEPQFMELGEFRDGLAAAERDGHFGFVDELGKTVLDFQYSNVLDFKSGVCAVFSQDYVYFIDKEGKRISEQYTRMYGPNENFWMHVIKDGKWGLMRDDNTFVLPFEYDLPKAMGQVLHTIEMEMIPIKKGPLIGFANKNGQEVVAPKYMVADPFCEGLSLVSILDPNLNFGKTPTEIEATGSISGVFNYGFINVEGKEVVKPQYMLAHRFHYGLAFVKNNNFQVGHITYDGTEYFND